MQETLMNQLLFLKPSRRPHEDLFIFDKPARCTLARTVWASTTEGVTERARAPEELCCPGRPRRTATQDSHATKLQARPPAGLHQLAMLVVVFYRDLEMIKEEITSYKIGLSKGIV